MCLILLQYVSATHPTLYNTDLLLSFSQRSLEKKEILFPNREFSHIRYWSRNRTHISASEIIPVSITLRTVGLPTHTGSPEIMVNVSVLAEAVTKGIFVSVYSSFLSPSSVDVWTHSGVHKQTWLHSSSVWRYFSAVTSILNQQTRYRIGVDI